MSNYRLAWNYFQRALEYSDMGSQMSICVCCNLGKVYTYVKDYSMAMRGFELAMVMALTLKEGDNPAIPVIYDSMGDLFTQMELYQDAILNYEKALDLYSKIYGKEHEYVAKALYNTGNVLFLMEDYNKALKYELKALEIVNKLDNISGKFIIKDIYALVGDIYQEKKDVTLAYDYWCKSYEIRKELYSNDMFFRHNSIGAVMNFNSKGIHEEKEDSLSDKLRYILNKKTD